MVRFDMVIGIVPASLRQAAQAGAIEAGTDLPLLTKGTMDEDVMKAISGKADKQEALMQAVKARINKYKGGNVNG